MNDNHEKPAVKTTIVGGRPQGAGKEHGSIPRGIEILVKKASIDHDFKKVLLRERAKAAKRIDLSLEKSEVNILNNIPMPHLEGMISATKVSPNMRKIFLGCTASVMLAALTSSAANAGMYESDFLTNRTRGISPGFKSSDYMVPETFSYDTTESEQISEPYFMKAGSDLDLETGTLIIKIIDRSSGKGLDKIKVHFSKHTDEYNANTTEGLDYTNKDGSLRIDGLPEGFYKIKVESSEYQQRSTQITILANKMNILHFTLEKK